MAQSAGAVALDIVMGKNTVNSVVKDSMSELKRVIDDETASFGNKVSAFGTACNQMGGAILPVSAATTAGIKSSINAAMSFETAMAQVRTIAGDTAVSYKGSMMEMDEAIMQLSSDTGIASEEIALATYNAISAGVNTADAVEFVSTANALAVGGFTNMTTSVDILTTTLNAYGEKAGTAEQISDKLITTQNLGKTTVDELSQNMGRVIPIASAYGVSVDNLCASYVALTKGGISTAESTTYLKSMFNELADSNSEVSKILMEKTNKSFGQLMAEGYNLADIIDILGQSVDGDTEKFAQLWSSSEAGTGALAILNGGTADFSNTLKEMKNSTGAASDAMDKMNDTSAHKMQVALNDIKNAAIELGAAFTPVFTEIADIVSGAARAFSSLSPEVQGVIAKIMMIVAVAAPVLLIVGKFISIIGSVISAIGMIKGAIMGFTGFISGTVMPALSGFFSFLMANPIVLVIAGIIAAGALLITHWDEVKQIASDVWNGIKDIIAGVWDFIYNVIIQPICDLIVNVVTTAWNIIKTITTTIWNIIKTIITTVWNIIKTIISTVCGLIVGIITTAWNIIVTITTTVWNIISTIISTVCNFIVNIVTTAWNIISTITTTIWNVIKTVITTVWNFIKTIITTVCNTVKTVISTAWNFISSITSTIFNGIKNTATNIWNGIKNTITTVVNGIKNGICNAFQSAYNFITNLFSNIASFFSGVWSKVASTFTNLGTKIGDAISGAVKSGINGVIGMIEGIINKGIGLINGAIKLINKIPGVNVGKLGELNLPRLAEGAVLPPNEPFAAIVGDQKHGTNVETPLSTIQEAVFNVIGRKLTAILSLPDAIISAIKLIPAPALKNVGSAEAKKDLRDDNKLYDLLNKILIKLDDTGDITVPVYLGNDLIDEQIIRANDRRTVRSGGRA